MGEDPEGSVYHFWGFASRRLGPIYAHWKALTYATTWLFEINDKQDFEADYGGVSFALGLNSAMKDIKNRQSTKIKPSSPALDKDELAERYPEAISEYRFAKKAYVQDGCANEDGPYRRACYVEYFEKDNPKALFRLPLDAQVSFEDCLKASDRFPKLKLGDRFLASVRIVFDPYSESPTVQMQNLDGLERRP